MTKKRYLVIISLVAIILGIIIISQFMVDAAAVNEFQINIEKIRVTNIGLYSCELWVTIHLTNPTNRDLSIESASFNIYVADSYVGKSSLSQMSFPRNSSREQIISLTLLYSTIPTVVIEAIKNNNFLVYVSGDAHIDVFYGLFTISVPFSISSTNS